jgi:hypothetical protein
MRFLYLLFPVLLLSACGGRNIHSGEARDIIISSPQAALEKEDIDVVKVIQSSGSEVVVETQLNTAFRIEKVQGKWEVREVRLGHGQWEKIGNLIRTLEMVKFEETRDMLDKIAQSIQAYRKSTGALPEFTDYISLSDKLSPKFMTPLIRLDAWRRPLGATRTKDAISIWSNGPDGNPGTSDDIQKSVVSSQLIQKTD